jgi:hypothetical protein
MAVYNLAPGRGYTYASTAIEAAAGDFWLPSPARMKTNEIILRPRPAISV